MERTGDPMLAPPGAGVDGSAAAPTEAEEPLPHRRARGDSPPRYPFDRPARRPLQIYTFDPMRANTLERQGPGVLTITVPWEDVAPGPSGSRIQVIDLDGAAPTRRPASDGTGPQRPLRTFYQPLNLNDPQIAAQAGIAPSEGDPRFHQQMAYAVAMRTLEAYDKALGRRVRPVGGRLRMFPHAFRGRNAFYHPDLRAVLFGYFEADTTNIGPNLPGQFVFTALSHDIIVHEVTHGLVHRIRPMLLDQTNRDVGAFHEAMADLTAIFLHFTLPGVIEAAIASTRTELATASAITDLADQFGYATGEGRPLRSAIDRPDPSLYATQQEPHARGAILVAAVFEAFLSVYRRRIADLLRLATGGTGELPPGSLHPDLVARVAREAVHAADRVLTICLRAFDYLPPLDVTFSDFLRAAVTADRELYPTDGGGYRVALIDAFRRRGIYPQDVLSLSEGSLVWPEVDRDVCLPSDLLADILVEDTLSLDPTRVVDDLPVKGTRLRLTADAQRAPGGRRLALAARIEAALAPYAAALDLSPSGQLQVRSFQATFRYDEDGVPHVNFVVECTQRLEPTHAPRLPRHLIENVIRRSCTVIFDGKGAARHIIAKPLPAADLAEPVALAAARRLDDLQDWLADLESRDAGRAFGLKPRGPGSWRIDFAGLHRSTR